MRRQTLYSATKQVIAYGFLGGMACIMLAPLAWLICAAFKDSDDMFHYTFASPNPTLANFRYLLELDPPFYTYVINSVFVSSALVLLQLFFSSLAGFALAKYEFRGKRTLMVVMLSTMMIPGQILLAPMYDLLYRVGLIDTYWALTIPGAVSVFGIILFRQSMMQIPNDLLDAGRIDGCSEFRVYWDIVLPVSRPMIGAFTLISFMGAWNSFLWPQIVLNTRARFTLPVALNEMIGIYTQDYGTLMAGTLVSILPVALLFFLLQKEFLAGLTAGAVKG
jgi:multiple sugar transport system permease protein